MQTTIKKSVTISGIGLHTGTVSKVVLYAAPANTGVVFMHGHKLISLGPEMAFGDYLNSYIMLDKKKIYTVEHLIAAIFGLGIDNILIRVEGDEVPILDGSCRGWTERLRDNIELLDKPVSEYIMVDTPVKIESKDSFAVAFPSEDLRITYIADYGDGAMSYDKVINGETFISDISDARTFGFERDIEYMRSQGLIKGGSLDCAVMIYNDGTQSSPDRLPDEKIRHKVLDFIGDMGLLGKKIKGHFVIYKGGHTLHGLLRDKLTGSGK